MTPDRHPSEDELVRAHLHLANQAVSELARRLRSHVNRDDLCSAAMLEIAAELGVTESRVSQLRAEALILLRDGLNAHLDPDTLPAEPRPDSRLLRLPGPAGRGPAAPARAGRRERLGGTHASLNSRSDNGFAWPGRCWITFLRSPPSLPVLLPSRRYAPFAPGLERLRRLMR
jgi:hypothetical protein